MSYVSIPEAADVIGVTDRRVRAMIADGLLAAERVGGRWLLSDTEVARLAATPRKPGRPYSPAHAWGLLAIAGQRATPWLSSSDRRRLEVILATTSIDELAPALRRRAESRRWYVHPGLLADLRTDDRTVAGGPGAAPGIRYDGPHHLYVSDTSIDALRAEYRPMVDAATPTAIVRIIHSAWPFVDGEREAWSTVIAVDLLDESLDIRAQRVARSILESSRG